MATAHGSFASTITLAAASAQAQVQDRQSNLSDIEIGMPTQTSTLGAGFAQVVGFPDPFATSTVTGGNFKATGDLSYQFEIVGPKGTVPFFIYGAVSAQGASGADQSFYFAGAVFTLK